MGFDVPTQRVGTFPRTMHALQLMATECTARGIAHDNNRVSDAYWQRPQPLMVVMVVCEGHGCPNQPWHCRDSFKEMLDKVAADGYANIVCHLFHHPCPENTANGVTQIDVCVEDISPSH